MSSRWPLHPQPHEYEGIDRWIDRLAAEYGVSKPAFCRQALGLTRAEIGCLRQAPPEEVLRKLEAGTGVPLQRLQDMTVLRIMQRVMEAVERFRQENPEGFAELERQWTRPAPTPDGPAAGSDRASRG